jgi:manganese/iron transport system permease protein
LSLADLLLEPIRFDLTRRALIELTVLGIAGGAIGVLVVLRGLSFIGDALGHCVVPGVVVAHLLHGPIALWGGATALLSAWGIALLVRRLRLAGDPAIAIVFSGAFALGLAMISATRSYYGALTEILFGNVLAVGVRDITISTAMAGAVVLALVALYRPLVFASCVPDGARAVGLPVGALDFGLYALIALAIVAGLSAVGTLLVTALLIVPAATARRLARSVARQMVVSAALAVLAGWIGLYASYHLDVASGGAIVLASVGLFALALVVSVRRSPLARRREPGWSAAGSSAVR